MRDGEWSEVPEESRLIWDEKYRFKQPDGTSSELIRGDTHRRVVEAIYKDDPDHAQEALNEMVALRWMPAGRIHAGAGTGRRVTLINCFVSPEIEDSMRTERNQNSKGIMEALTVAALTQQMGGGIGMDFSTLRPKGAIVRSTGSVSDGPLKFMDMWNAMCATIMSSGSRRGAMMGTLRCDHPDIEEFIAAKREPGRLTNFNVSVLVTDEFMQAVEAGKEWELGFPVPRADGKHLCLRRKAGPVVRKGAVVAEAFTWYVYKRLPARQLWDAILRNTYEHAEPGVIFIDRVNELNNLGYCEIIYTSNPCGEQILPPNGDCNLGHINLAKMVVDPFTDRARFDEEALRKTVRVGVRFLDNVLDVSLFPTEEQKQEALSKRRIGLGITGLANMLEFLRVRYGNSDAVKMTRYVMQVIRDEAYAESVKLARELGPFPCFNKDEFFDAPFVRRLPDSIRDSINEHGIRNGVLLSIAPTGTTSIYYDNVSSGLEPVFAHEYERHVLLPDGKKTIKVKDYGWREYQRVFDFDGMPSGKLPEYMVTAHELGVDEHLAMAAACQEFVDSAVSKTINCPASMAYEEFKEVYTKAYVLRLKGCTTYRPSGVRGEVLRALPDHPSRGPDPSPPAGAGANPEDLPPPGSAPVGGAPVPNAVPLYEGKRPRPDALEGRTYKVRWPGNEAAYYVTVNDEVTTEGRHLPFELFINGKVEKHRQWISALTRLVSAILRRGGDVKFLVEELKQVHSSESGYIIDKEYCPSEVALIGRVLEKHFRRIGLYDSFAEKPVANNQCEPCPKCGQRTLVHESGCSTCRECGWSNCG